MSNKHSATITSFDDGSANCSCTWEIQENEALFLTGFGREILMNRGLPEITIYLDMGDELDGHSFRNKPRKKN